MTEATLANWRTAPINSRLEAALTFMEKLTTNPEGSGSKTLPNCVRLE